MCWIRKREPTDSKEEETKEKKKEKYPTATMRTCDTRVEKGVMRGKRGASVLLCLRILDCVEACDYVFVPCELSSQVDTSSGVVFFTPLPSLFLRMGGRGCASDMVPPLGSVDETGDETQQQWQWRVKQAPACVSAKNHDKCHQRLTSGYSDRNSRGGRDPRGSTVSLVHEERTRPATQAKQGGGWRCRSLSAK